ncbi:hypothetical protein FNF29_07507 [Cafeteria roenbergensis]|uniref:Uncharacterized protein n=1 Tax=Cafeteria roenbergensis TaxID=33653 RepID=A0A5A8C2G3_CAFRO|nr:hypothetical protein FNF29_07507 [Cafeteria roenbergensis]|eukprot:KAA0147246.1 hypothetical protein FNF29_07507 [Cafeteria roenbergensis]
MRRAKTRTRPLDIYKRMPILRKQDELPIDAETVDSAVVRIGIVDLPVPEVSAVDTYEEETKGGFKPPRPYIRHKPGTQIRSLTCEYEADHDDEAWLKTHAKFGTGNDSATRLSLDLFERVMDALEQEAGRTDSMPTLTEASRVVAERTGLKRTGANSTLDDVYTYWRRKRERLKKPLLRRFWPPTSENNADPHATFRQRTKERYRLRRTRRSDDMASYRKLADVRQTLARAMALLDMVHTREQAKLELARIAVDSFEQAVFEATDTTGTTRTPPVLQTRRFERTAAEHAAASRAQRLKNKGKRRQTRTTSSATTAAHTLYKQAMAALNPAQHAERVAALQGVTGQMAAQHGARAASGKVPVPFRTGPWRAPFFTAVHPAAGLAFSRWPLAPTAGDPDASRVGHSDGELEDVATAAALLAAAPNGAPVACSLSVLQAHGGVAATPPPHALSVHASALEGRRSVARMRDRGALVPLGMGGSGAGEAEADVLGLGAASGLPVGFERDEQLVADLLCGRGTNASAEMWLHQRRPALHVDTTARLRALMLQHRTTNVSATLGMVTPGSAWEEVAGLALGVGSLGNHGEGWDLTGHRPQLRSPDMLEAQEWRVVAAVAHTAAVNRQARRQAEASAAKAAKTAALLAQQEQQQMQGTASSSLGSTPPAAAAAELARTTAAAATAAIAHSRSEAPIRILAGSARTHAPPAPYSSLDHVAVAKALTAPGTEEAEEGADVDMEGGASSAPPALSWEEEEALLYLEEEQAIADEQAARDTDAAAAASAAAGSAPQAAPGKARSVSRRGPPSRRGRDKQAVMPSPAAAAGTATGAGETLACGSAGVAAAASPAGGAAARDDDDEVRAAANNDDGGGGGGDDDDDGSDAAHAGSVVPAAEGWPLSSQRRCREEVSRHAAAAASEAGAGGWATGRHADAPATYITRARVGRGGRVWVDRVSAPAGSDLGQRRRAAFADVAARDALRAREEAERAAAGGAEAVAVAAARAAGFEPPQSGHLAAAVWQAGTRPRRGDDMSEALGLSAGLDAPEPGTLHSTLAAALGPAAGGTPPSGAGGDAAEAAGAWTWQVRSRLLDASSAVLAGGGATGTVGGGASREAFSLAAGAAQLAGAHGGHGARMLRRLAGLPAGASAGRADGGVRASPGSGAGGMAPVAGSGMCSDLHNVALPVPTGHAVDSRAWPWLAGTSGALPPAGHLAAPAFTSHTGLIAQRLGTPETLQHTKPVRPRRLEQVYLGEDNADSELVEAEDAAKSELAHAAGTACPGGVGNAATIRGVALSVGAAVDEGSGPQAAALEASPGTSGDDEGFWARAVRAARPSSVIEQAQLLSRAAIDMAA